MTIFDIYPKYIAYPMAALIWIAQNWFWIKWICIAIIVFILAKAIRKHNKKVDEQKREENKQ